MAIGQNGNSPLCCPPWWFFPPVFDLAFFFFFFPLNGFLFFFHSSPLLLSLTDLFPSPIDRMYSHTKSDLSPVNETAHFSFSHPSICLTPLSHFVPLLLPSSCIPALFQHAISAEVDKASITRRHISTIILTIPALPNCVAYTRCGNCVVCQSSKVHSLMQCSLAIRAQSSDHSDIRKAPSNRKVQPMILKSNGEAKPGVVELKCG